MITVWHTTVQMAERQVSRKSKMSNSPSLESSPSHERKMEDGFAVIFTCVSVYFPLDQQTLEFFRVWTSDETYIRSLKLLLFISEKFVDLLVLNTD